MIVRREKTAEAKVVAKVVARATTVGKLSSAKDFKGMVTNAESSAIGNLNAKRPEASTASMIGMQLQRRMQ